MKRHEWYYLVAWICIYTNTIICAAITTAALEKWILGTGCDYP